MQYLTTMVKTLRLGILFLALILTSALTIKAQVVEVDPTRPVIYSRARSIEVNITNPGTKAVDVSIGFEYGVSRYDSMGEVSLISDSLTSEELSRDCSSWLKVFPRRMVLPARGSRTIRIISTIPQGTADGEYWARLLLACELQNATIEIPSLDTNNADVALGTAMSTIVSLPLAVRVGKFDTGVSIETVTAAVDTTGKSLLLCDLRREGNSPYRGTLEATIKQSPETEIAKLSTGITVEFNARVPLKLPKMADGTYKLDLNVLSVRGGSYTDIIINAPTIKKSYTMTVSGSAVSFQPE